MIRALFAGTPDAKAKGYSKGRFSFNVKGGRCEACGGDGILKIEMHFLPDVYVPCEVCHGKRYNRETLDVRYKGKNIFDVLDMTVEEAVTFFENVPSIRRKSPPSGAKYRRFTTSASAMSSSGSPPQSCQAAKRSASSWRQSCPARAQARPSIFWTSLRQASISRTSPSST